MRFSNRAFSVTDCDGASWMYTRKVAIAGALALMLACVASAGSIGDSRGQKWIDSHPFTVNALVEAPYNAQVYKEIGFNSVLGKLNLKRPTMPDYVFGKASQAGLPWHWFYRWHVGDDEKLVALVKEFRSTYPGNIGFSIGDESYLRDFEKLGEALDLVRQAAPDAIVHTAMGGMDWGKPELWISGSGAYEKYVDEVIRLVKPDVLMFNMYPFYRKGLATHFFRNLDVVTTKAEEAGIPCWNWLQGFAFEEKFGPHHAPSESEINLQAFVSLAYGCKGLSYWTYASHWYPYRECIISESGAVSPIGQNIRSVLPEIRTVGERMKRLQKRKVFYCPAAFKSSEGWVSHCPIGTRRFTSGAIKDIREVQVSDGKWGFLLSSFDGGNGDEYLMVVNCSHGYQKSAADTRKAITIMFDYTVNDIERLNRRTGRFESIPLYVHTLRHHFLDGGTGDLFRIRKGNSTSGAKSVEQTANPSK